MFLALLNKIRVAKKLPQEHNIHRGDQEMGIGSRILVEARNLAVVEVATALNACRSEDAVGNCIHGDGTSKFHHKYQNYQITRPDGSSRSVGLTETAAGDTSAIFDSFT